VRKKSDLGRRLFAHALRIFVENCEEETSFFDSAMCAQTENKDEQKIAVSTFCREITEGKYKKYFRNFKSLLRRQVFIATSVVLGIPIHIREKRYFKLYQAFSLPEMMYGSGRSDLLAL
jgi:hypothetical protein